MKYITELRELTDDNKIKDILYFEDEIDADNYNKTCPYKCIKKKINFIEKGENVDLFKKEKLKIIALSKLSDEEKEILGLNVRH